MKAMVIRLSEVTKSLELLKNLCNMNEICSTCWLYDPDEKGTACFLAKEKLESLADNIDAAQRYIENVYGCIMMQYPYCPNCEYGFITYPEDTMPGETDINTKWHCTYDPEVKGNEAASVSDGLADTPGTDQDDRSGA